MQLITLPIRSPEFYGVGYGVTACVDGRTAFALTGYDSGPGVLWRVDIDAGRATGRMGVVTDDEHGTCWPPPVVSPDGRCVAFGDRLKRFGRKGRVTLAGTSVPRGFHWSVVDPLAFTPDGRRLVGTAEAVGGRTPVHVWDVPRGRVPDPSESDPPPLVWGLPERRAPAGYAPARTLYLPAGDRGAVSAAAVGPGGGLAVVTADRDRPLSTLRLHRADLPGGRWLAPVDLPDGADESTAARLAYSPDGRTLAVGTRAGAYLFDAAAGAPRRRCGPAATGVAFAPDSARLVTVTRHGTAGVWDAATGDRVAHYDWRRIAGRLAGVAVSPDGLTAIASGTRGRLVRWDLPE